MIFMDIRMPVMNGHVAKPIDLGHVLKEIRKVKRAKHG